MKIERSTAAAVLTLASAILGGCLNSGSSGTSSAAVPVVPLTAPASAAGAGVVMLDGARVVVVDDPANASADASAISGATVDAYNHLGELILSTMTDAAGEFVFDGLPTGYVRVEIRQDPMSADADAVVELTAVPDVVLAVGAEYPVTRSDAALLAVAGVADDALVLGTMKPLPAGVAFYPESNSGTGYPTADEVREFSADSWFFLVDRGPLLEYTHGVEYVTVDAATGAVNRYEAAFRPLVNHGALWQSTYDYFVFSEDPALADPVDMAPDAAMMPTPEVVQMPALEESDFLPEPSGIPLGDYSELQSGFSTRSGDPTIRDNFNNSGADGVYVVFIRTGSESHHQLNISRLFNKFVDQGVDKFHMAVSDFKRQSAPDLGDTSNLSSEEATALRRDTLRGLLNLPLQFFEPSIKDRLDQGKHSTLILYITGHSGGGGYIIDFPDGYGAWGFKSEDLVAITESLACRVRIILQGCEAEDMQDDLAAMFAATEHDVIIYSASNHSTSATAVPGWVSFVPVLHAFIQGGSNFTKEFASEMELVNGDLGGVTETAPDGDVQLIEDLRTLPGMAPRPFVRPSHPSWCFPPEPDPDPPASTVCETAASFMAIDNDCGFVDSFTDTIIVTVTGNEMMTEQPSTGDVNVGTIEPDGSFFVESADGREHYMGTFDTGTCSGSATNSYTSTDGCTVLYGVEFAPGN